MLPANSFLMKEKKEQKPQSKATQAPESKKFKGFIVKKTFFHDRTYITGEKVASDNFKTKYFIELVKKGLIEEC